jgi:glutamate racemase
MLKDILKTNINYLQDNYNLDFIIIACNTISTLVDYSLMLNCKIPILKTVPKIKNIKNGGKNILVFATKNTIKNCKELKLIKFNYPKIKTLQIKNLPKLIDNYLAEKTKENNYEIEKILKYYFLNNIKFKLNNNLDTALYLKGNNDYIIKNINRYKYKKYVNKFNYKKRYFLKKEYNFIEYISLGCTHFKHIKNRLEKIFNNKVKFFECETDVAKNSKWLVRKNKKQSTLNLILTQKDMELENSIYAMFDCLVNKNNIWWQKT